MKQQYFIALKIELGVAVSETFHAESNITPVHSVLPLPVLLSHNLPSLWSFFLLRRWNLAYKMPLLVTALCCLKNVSLALRIPVYLHTSQEVLQLTESRMAADQFFSPRYFWHSKLKYS
jgi:hypothetical protein